MKPIALSGIPERFQLVFENASIGILVGDTNNRIVHANKALREMLGYDSDELAMMDIVDLIHRDDLPLSKKLFTELLSGKRDSSQLEERYLHKDGHDVLCKTGVTLVCDKQDHPQMFICTLEDISERKYAHVSAHRLIQQYEQILNSTGFGICGVDRSGRILFVNHEAARMLAWNANDLIGKPVGVIARAGSGVTQSSEIENAVNDALCDGLIRHSDGNVFIGRGGASFSAEYTIAPLIEDGLVNGVAILFMDISLRVESNRKIQACMKNLMQLNGALIARLQTGRTNRSSGDLPHIDGQCVAMEVVEMASSNVSKNNYSHADHLDEWMEIDIHDCIDNVLDMIGSEINGNTQIRRLYASLPAIQCVPAQISQLMLSLLMNACHVSNAQRIVTIRTGTQQHENEEGIWIEIADNGILAPEENDAQIFDPFFVATLGGSGIGMGLPLSYQIMRKHHGRITMESEPGKHSAFRIWLPLQPQGAGK